METGRLMRLIFRVFAVLGVIAIVSTGELIVLFFTLPMILPDGSSVLSHPTLCTSLVVIPLLFGIWYFAWRWHRLANWFDLTMAMMGFLSGWAMFSGLIMSRTTGSAMWWVAPMLFVSLVLGGWLFSTALDHTQKKTPSLR